MTTKILPDKNSDVLAVKNTTKIAIKILQGSAVTQKTLDGLIICANFLRCVGLPKIMPISWHVKVTSVDKVDRFYWHTVFFCVQSQLYAWNNMNVISSLISHLAFVHAQRQTKEIPMENTLLYSFSICKTTHNHPCTVQKRAYATRSNYDTIWRFTV